MEGRIAVLGDTDFVMPFAALGLDTYAVGDTREDILASAREVVDGEYALVVVAEHIAKDAHEIFDEVEQQPTPCIAVVPFTTEPEGFATRALGEVLRQATGINILENE